MIDWKSRQRKQKRRIQILNPTVIGHNNRDASCEYCEVELTPFTRCSYYEHPTEARKAYLCLLCHKEAVHVSTQEKVAKLKERHSKKGLYVKDSET